MKQIFKALNMIRLCDSRAFWLRIVYVVITNVLPLVNLYILKFMVDSVTTGEYAVVLGVRMDVFTTLGLYCAVFLLNRIVAVFNSVNNDIISQKLIDYISERMQGQSAMLDMSYFDNPEYHDTYHRAQQEASYRPIQILNGFMTLLGSLITIAGIVTMLASASGWIIVVMVVAVVPSFIVRVIKARKIYAFRRNNTQNYRRTSYYTALLGGRDYAKEMRTFGLAPFFRKRFVAIREALVKELLRISRCCVCRGGDGSIVFCHHVPHLLCYRRLHIAGFVCDTLRGFPPWADTDDQPGQQCDGVVRQPPVYR